MNLTRKNSKLHHQVKNEVERRVRILSIVTFEDNEFNDNKALNDQVKDEGTIIVTAQFNLNMSWSLTMVRNPPPPPPSNFYATLRQPRKLIFGKTTLKRMKN
jgi:hypothetical protein